MKLKFRHLLIILTGLLFLVPNVSFADDACDSQHVLLTNTMAPHVSRCLREIKYKFGKDRSLSPKFLDSFFALLLPLNPNDTRLPREVVYRLNYLEIAEAIAITGSKKYIEKYVRLIINTPGSADELRSYGLGKLYTLQAPLLLEILARTELEARNRIIDQASWGLVNIHSPYLNKDNYKRMIVGVHWEIDPTYVSIQNEIEIRVEETLSAELQ